MNAEVWIHQLHLHDARWPNRLSSIESVWRNRRFQWILSPLLYLSYTSIAAAYDQTALTDAYDGPAIIFSLLFVVANFLQTVVVRDEILDPMMRRFLPYFPFKWLWPHLSPDLRLNHAEIIALKTGKPVKGEEEWPFHPRVKDFITEDTRTHYWRVLSAEYLTLRCQGLSVDHCVNKVADARRDDNEGPHSEAEQLRYMVKEWRRKVRAWDRYDLKMDRRKPKTKVQYMRQQLNRPMLSNVQIQEENRIVKRLKKIREALCYRPVQYMPIEMFAPSAKYGSDVVEWDFFKAESEPARLRWQLPALRAKFAKVENDPEFQKIFKENPTHGWTKMYNDNLRRGFTGKSKDPSPYDLPGAGDFVELLYLDGWFNSWEWDLAHKTHKKHQFAEWEANLDEEGHRNWELEKKERERLKKLVEDPDYDDQDKYVEERFEAFHRNMNAYPNWKPKRKRTPEPYDRNTLACENTPERGPDGERPLLTDRESSAKKRRKLAIRQARIDKLL